MVWKIITSRFYLFLFACLFFACLLFLLFLVPTQFPVVLHKIILVLLGATLGLLFDYLANPYARPTSYLKRVWYKQKTKQKAEGEADYQIAEDYFGVFCAVTIRRALVICAFIIAVAMGL